MARKKQLNSPQDGELLERFKAKCDEKGKSQAEVIENFLMAYVDDQIDFEKKIIVLRSRNIDK